MISGWTTTELQKIADVNSGGNAPQGKQYFEDGKYPFIRVQHFDGSKTYVDRFDLINDAAVKKYRLKKFKKGSILFPKSGASIRLEKRAKLPFDAFVVSHLCIVQPNEVVDDFLFYLLKRQKFAVSEGGSTLPFLNISQIKKTEIEIPKEKSEQQIISTILSKIQEAIENQNKIIETTTELKAALMRKLFSEGLNGEPLKETEIGKIPKSWEVKPLEEVVEIVYGAQAAVAHQKDSSIGTPIFTNINITNDGKIDTSTLRYYKVPEKKKGRLILKKGDILFNWRSGSKEHVGKTAIFNLEGEYTFSSFILRFRVIDKTDNRFLFYFLQYLKASKYFSQYRDQSSVNSVFNASAANKVPVALPKSNEQKEIVKILSTVDTKIENANQLAKAKTILFQSMLNNLMSGEIRVNNVKL